MIKVKNVRAGIVIIADAGLKLAPGETVSAEKPTTQMQSAVRAGILAQVNSDGDGKSKSKNTPKPAEAKSETADGGHSASDDSSTQSTDDAGANEPGKGDGATVEATPGVKRGGK